MTRNQRTVAGRAAVVDGEIPRFMPKLFDAVRNKFGFNEHLRMTCTIA